MCFLGLKHKHIVNFKNTESRKVPEANPEECPEGYLNERSDERVLDNRHILIHGTYIHSYIYIYIYHSMCFPICFFVALPPHLGRVYLSTPSLSAEGSVDDCQWNRHAHSNGWLAKPYPCLHVISHLCWVRFDVRCDTVCSSLEFRKYVSLKTHIC